MSIRRSFILTATASPAAVERWLEAVLPWRNEEDEIVVVAPFEVSPGPGFRVVSAPPGTPVPRLRGLGVAASRGGLLIFSEDSVLPGPDWSRSWTQPAAACGPVEYDGPASVWNQAVFLFEYGPFHRRVPTRLAGNNFSLPRPACLKEEVHEHEFALEVFVAEASVAHVRAYSVRECLIDRFWTGFAYGRRRWRTASRWLGPLALPAIAFLQGRRMIMLLRDPANARLRGCGPALSVLVLLWSLGESLGWLMRGPTSGKRSETSAPAEVRAASRRADCRCEPASVSAGA